MLTRNNGAVNGYEIKSSMKYSAEFQKTLSKMETFLKEPVGKRFIIYAGEMENNAADIELLITDT